MANILWIILAIVIILWLVGFISGFAGNLIHLILIVAAIILIVNLLTGRRSV